jgi:type II secretory pathway pseudopilin PulG
MLIQRANRRRNAGQSLVEILIVVAIMAVAISILIPSAFLLVRAVYRLKNGP